MKYIDADKIRAEMKRQIHMLRSSIQSQGDYGQSCQIVACENLLSFLDTLEEPVSDDLGEEIERASKRYPEVSYAKLARIAKRFAEWQKEQMLKDAEECELYWDGDFLAIDLNMAALGYSERDKVKIIIVKEDGE